jgi:Cu/Ag efflux protein CusF
VVTIKGNDWTFQLGDGAKVRVGDKDAKLADLRTGAEVQVTYREQAKAVRTAPGSHACGRVESVSAAKNQIVVKDDRGKEHTFHFGKEAKVRLDGKFARFADLKAGDEVVIAYEKADGRMVVRQLRSTRREHATRTALGEVKSISADKKQLTVKDAGGREHTFNLARDAKVQLGEKEGSLADLKTGTEVSVTYQALATNVRSNRP